MLLSSTASLGGRNVIDDLIFEVLSAIFVSSFSARGSHISCRPISQKFKGPSQQVLIFQSVKSTSHKDEII